MQAETAHLALVQLKLQHSVGHAQGPPAAVQAATVEAHLCVAASQSVEQQSAPVWQMSPNRWQVGGELTAPPVPVLESRTPEVPPAAAVPAEAPVPPEALLPPIAALPSGPPSRFPPGPPFRVESELPQASATAAAKRPATIASNRRMSYLQAECSDPASDALGASGGEPYSHAHRHLGDQLRWPALQAPT